MEVYIAGNYNLKKGKCYKYTSNVNRIGNYPTYKYYADENNLQYVGEFNYSIEQGYRDNQNRFDYFINNGQEIVIDHRSSYDNYYIEVNDE